MGAPSIMPPASAESLRPGVESDYPGVAVQSVRPGPAHPAPLTTFHDPRILVPFLTSSRSAGLVGLASVPKILQALDPLLRFHDLGFPNHAPMSCLPQWLEDCGGMCSLPLA